MKVSQQGLEDALKKYLQELEPVAKSVATKNEVKQEPRQGGGTDVSVVQTKGDVYMDRQNATALAKSIAKSVHEHVVGYMDDPMVTKLNELIAQYNQLRSDFVTGGGSTTSTAVDQIPTS